MDGEVVEVFRALGAYLLERVDTDENKLVSYDEREIEYDLLELYVTARGNGLPIETPALEYAEIDFETIFDDVLGAACTIFAPASWCWPSPA